MSNEEEFHEIKKLEGTLSDRYGGEILFLSKKDLPAILPYLEEEEGEEEYGEHERQ